MVCLLCLTNLQLHHSSGFSVGWNSLGLSRPVQRRDGHTAQSLRWDNCFFRFFSQSCKEGKEHPPFCPFPFLWVSHLRLALMHQTRGKDLCKTIEYKQIKKLSSPASKCLWRKNNLSAWNMTKYGCFFYSLEQVKSFLPNSGLAYIWTCTRSPLIILHLFTQSFLLFLLCLSWKNLFAFDHFHVFSWIGWLHHLKNTSKAASPSSRFIEVLWFWGGFNLTAARLYSLLLGSRGKRKPMQSFHRMEEESGASALLMRLYIGKQN